MKLTLLVLTLALIWVAITDGFTLANLLFGAVVALAAVFLLRDEFARPRVLRRLRLVLALATLFLRELVVSAFRVAMIVLTPNLDTALKPAIIAFPLSLKSDGEITVLANLITLTPGTLSVDVSSDRQWLYVHVLSLSTREALIADIANGFEKRVREVFA